MIGDGLGEVVIMTELEAAVRVGHAPADLEVRRTEVFSGVTRLEAEGPVGEREVDIRGGQVGLEAELVKRERGRAGPDVHPEAKRHADVKTGGKVDGPAKGDARVSEPFVDVDRNGLVEVIRGVDIDREEAAHRADREETAHVVRPEARQRRHPVHIQIRAQPGPDVGLGDRTVGDGAAADPGDGVEVVEDMRIDIE